MADPIIYSLDSLKKLPVFPDNTTVSNMPKFHQYNLFYGFNACGKTTLSRMFACLGTGERHEEWDAESSFSVTLTDGTKIKLDTIDSKLNQRILVFNTDFIKKRFRWKECEADPVFFIDEQKDLSEQIDLKDKRIELFNARLQPVSTLHNESERAFAQHKRDRAILIENGAGLGRRYIATNLESDYSQYTYNDTDLLDEKDISSQRQILKLDSPLPKLPKISEQSPKIRKLILDVETYLKTTIGSITIKQLSENDDMLPWVKLGLDYHKANDLKTCLFCGNPLTEKRILALEKSIDEQYEKLVTDIAFAKKKAEDILDSFKLLESSLPSTNDVATDLRENFTTTVSTLRLSIRSCQQQLNLVIEQLTQKQKSPNKRITLEYTPGFYGADKWLHDYQDKATSFNEIIDNHNTANDEFKAKQSDAKDKLKNHYLAMGYEEFHDLKSRTAKSSRLAEKIRTRINLLTTENENNKQQMLKHGPAADIINQMIHRYLGHKELEIASKDEGYEIRRNGTVSPGSPSEGEKTAIALSYFLVLLESEGRRRENLIVVLDDPISSLDTQSLNYACILIRSLENVSQLIILTHNAHVMNELKKWLKSKTEKAMKQRNRSKDEANASLFFIDTIQPGDSDSRRSRIIELPKHLREYDSEYHYLFHMMLRYIESEEDRTNYFFVMPNVLRKVMEIFLSFKRPGNDGLSSKINGIAGKANKIGFDEMRIRSLDRLVQVESHGDNIDDLVTVSKMTIEETKVAAETLVELIKIMDTDHSRLMHKQCRPVV